MFVRMYANIRSVTRTRASDDWKEEPTGYELIENGATTQNRLPCLETGFVELFLE
jgi:hypothetical protein